MRQIAAEFTSSKTAVRNALVRFGIPIRERAKNPFRRHNLPFGKKCLKGKVVDHDREKKVIRSILKMHADGLSNQAIAQVLTSMGIPTKKRMKKWHPELVRQILLRRGPA